MNTTPAKPGEGNASGRMKRARQTKGGSIAEYMGRDLDASADMADAQTVLRHHEATRSYVDALAAQMPCNSRIGSCDLWDVVCHIAARILPFADGLHEFTQECHRIRSFVGQALTRPAYEVSGSSRMGSLDIVYSTMPGVMRVTISDGSRTTGFGFVLGEDETDS